MRVKQLAPLGAAVFALGLVAVPHSTLYAQASAAKTDSGFVKEAASGGMLEVELGQLAQQKASNPQVKQFGQRMVTDHSKANKQLASAAQQSGLPVPATPDSKTRQEVAQLSSKSGKDFDTAYMQLMLKDHVQDVQAFQQEASRGKSPAVKQVAAKTVPVLEEHLTLAKHVAGQVGVDTTATSGMEQ